MYMVMLGGTSLPVVVTSAISFTSVRRIEMLKWKSGETRSRSDTCNATPLARGLAGPTVTENESPNFG